MTELLQFILDHEKAFQSTGRLASLYSDFRLQASTNPDGYNANISAWRKALTDAARAGLIPAQAGSPGLLTIQTGEELVQALDSKQWGRPLALGSVIRDAVEKKEMIPVKDFLSSSTSIYNKSWMITPGQVISWMLRQLGVTGGVSAEDKLSVGNFVLVANVEAAADAIIKKQSPLAMGSASNIYSLSTFTSTFSHALSPSHPLSSTDISILLTYLSRDRPSLSYSPTSQTIKFKSNSDPHPTPITDQDTTVASLNTLIASLHHQIPVLSTRISALDTEARAAISSSSSSSSTRTTARSALRSKKLAEATLAQRSTTLAQLEATLGEIQTAADHVDTVSAMRDAAGVLRALHARVGGAEGVEAVVEGLREEMGRVEEVSGVLQEVGGEVVEEGEVEEEFEMLEREAREKEEKLREEREAEVTRRRLRELEEMEERRKAEEEEKRKAEGEAEGNQEREENGKMSREYGAGNGVREETPVRQAAEQVKGMTVNEERSPPIESQAASAVPAE